MGVDCNNCKNKGKCGTSIALDLIRTGGKDAFVSCKSYEPQTNADRIRAMTDEELAEWIAGRYPDCPPGTSPAPLGCDDVCSECWLEWLRQEATQ